MSRPDIPAVKKVNTSQMPSRVSTVWEEKGENDRPFYSYEKFGWVEIIEEGYNPCIRCGEGPHFFASRDWSQEKGWGDWSYSVGCCQCTG